MRRRVLLLSLCLVLSVFSFAAARPQADSVILFIGDGMGPNAVELTRLARGGQLLEMQRLPYSGVVTTHNVAGEITDSAAAGTAYATGTKTANGMLGVSPGGERLETLVERARARGKAAGLVTTDDLWGATPAAFAVHVGSRGEYAEIARQMVASGAQVLMGYGTDQMTPKAAGGARADNLDLLQVLRKGGYDIVTNRQQLEQSRRLRVVGLFGQDAPSLEEMVNAALLRLDKNRRGFVLVVEEAGTDGGGHGSDPGLVVQKVQSLDHAVAAAVAFARRDGHTLVLVTADHETGGLLIETPAKATVLAGVKADKWEMAGKLDEKRTNVAAVLKEWAGIGATPAEVEQIQKAPDAADAIGAVISVRAGVRWTGSGHHTKTPVRIFAFGPGAERFTGELDNVQVPSRVAEVLGLGVFPK